MLDSVTLERQLVRRHAVAVEGALHGRDEVRLPQLSSREVDRDARADDAPLRPPLHLCASLFQDGRPDGRDGSGLLGALDERVGIQQAPLGVAPSHEGLDRGDPPRPDLDDGLVVQLQLFRSSRQDREVGLERDPAEDVGQHLRVEDLETVLPGVLRLVQGHVRRPQQLVGLAAGLRHEGDADADGQVHALARDEQLGS
jgi:hypothetical protein